jgi:hypothetical protein
MVRVTSVRRRDLVFGLQDAEQVLQWPTLFPAAYVAISPSRRRSAQIQAYTTPANTSTAVSELTETPPPPKTRNPTAAQLGRSQPRRREAFSQLARS